MDKTVVFLTGFGPFEGHETNASWEAVKLVPTLNTEEELSIKLFVEQLPVVYSSIEKLVPELKLAYKPDVTIHVGVYNGRGIRIEEFAKKKGYTKNDIIDNCPKGGICSTGSDDVLCTQINLPLLSRTFFNETKQPIYISKEAGNYLCEYTYYVSLNDNQGKALFVHVPRLNHPYTALELATNLKILIKCILQQVNNTIDNLKQ